MKTALVRSSPVIGALAALSGAGAALARSSLVIGALVAALGGAGAALADPPTPSRRAAIVIGSNDGGTTRVPLRYAETDAESFARVLEQFGGLARADRQLLLGPSRQQILAALGSMKALAAVPRDGARFEALIYFSGHSDEEGLMLGNERLGYGELRSAIDAIPADVRIAILDSCASGAMIRAKGGKQLAPFLIDGARVVKGHAYLTAASADEAAQESERIKASYFTAALVTGLRGAADTSRDGRVTLNEAYAYAFAETLSRTAKTRVGAQHPAYDLQLSGSGDLVLTDLRDMTARLEFAPDIKGKILLQRENGAFVAELRKDVGTSLELGVEAGRYDVVIDDEGRKTTASIAVSDGARSTLDLHALSPFLGEAVATRGSGETSGFMAPASAGGATNPAAGARSVTTVSRTDSPENSEFGQGGYTRAAGSGFSLALDFGAAQATGETSLAPVYMGLTADYGFDDWIGFEATGLYSIATDSGGLLFGPKFRTTMWHPMSLYVSLRAGPMFLGKGYPYFALSPQIGGDFEVDDKFMMGLAYAYDYASGVPFKAHRIGMTVGMRF